MSLTLVNNNGLGNFSLINTSGAGNLSMLTTAVTGSSNLILSLDAGNPSSYPGSGTTWTDIIGSKVFTLYNGVTYNSGNGGYLNFVPSSGQYAESPTSLSDLNNWTVEAWHYYDGTSTGGSPCLVTEVWPNGYGNLNYNLGNGSDSSPLLQAGFFNGGWQNTSTYSLTSGNWYQIVGTFDGTTILLYVNGSVVGGGGYYGSLPISGGNGIRLMTRWDILGQYWGGNLAIVNIYSNALSNTQITQKFNLTKSRFGL